MSRPKRVQCDEGHFIEERGADSRRGGQPKRYCRPCNLKQWRRRARERTYGVSHAEWLQLLEDSDGLCAVCYEDPATDLDHNHATGAVRAAVCGKCNKGLGLFQEDPDRLKAAIEYLEVYT